MPQSTKVLTVEISPKIEKTGGVVRHVNPDGKKETAFVAQPKKEIKSSSVRGRLIRHIVRNL